MNKIFELSGKTALITGASSGLGETFAKILNDAGCRVILAARRIDKLEMLASQLTNAIPIKMDVSNKEIVTKAFLELEKKSEKIDICINNAGIAALTPIFADDENHDFEQIIQTNLLGCWYVTKAVANHMKALGIAGSIINIASVNGANKLREELNAYAASKAAIIHLTKALVGELSPHKIRINCIAPGLFHTPMTDHRLHTAEQRNTMAQYMPLGFVANPQDLAGTILLLASNEASSYLTGTCITVDGGVSWGG